MAVRCEPSVMYRRMLSGRSQVVMVQKVRRRSAKIDPPRNPGACRTCLSERRVCRANSGKTGRHASASAAV